MAQSSEFTIHGVESGLEDMENAENFLVTIKIPKAAKENFRNMLDLIEITESHLFPDLEHLSRYIENMIFTTT
jgi:hypothetical protein